MHNLAQLLTSAQVAAPDFDPVIGGVGLQQEIAKK
jgi:hypothetical protein